MFDCSFLHLDITLYLGCKLFEGRGAFNFQWYIPIGTVGHRLGIPYAALLKMTNYCCLFFFSFLLQFIEGPFEDYLKSLENPQVC